MSDAEGTAPSCVDDSEYVCRLGFCANENVFRDKGYPQTHDDDGYLRLSELSWVDFSEKGFSVQMRSLYSSDDAHAEALRRNQARLERTGVDVGYSVAGCHAVQVSKVREIKDDVGDEAFCVYDTRTEAEPAHAEIRVASQIKKADFLKLREMLRDTLGKIQPIVFLDH